MKIRNKLLVSFAPIAVISLIGVGIFSFLVFNRALKNKTLEQLDNISNETVVYLDDLIKNAETDLQILTLSLPIKHYLISDEITKPFFELPVYETINNLLRIRSMYSEIFLTDPAGQELVKATTGAITNINRFVGNEDWFVNAVGSGKTIFKQVVGNEETREAFLMVVAPLQYKKDDVASYQNSLGIFGYVAFKLPMEIVYNSLKNIRFGEEGFVYLTDDANKIIAHPDPKQLLASSATDDSTKYFQTNAASGGIINVVLEESLVEISRVNFKYKLVVATLVIAVASLIFVLIWYLSHFIARPIRKITDCSDLISSGNLDHKIEIDNRGVSDEIVMLAKTLETMRSEVKKYKEIEKQNAIEVAIGHMTSQIAHDMRSPISVVKNYLKFAKPGSSDENIVAYYEAANKSVEKLHGMTDELMDYIKANRIERNKVDIGELLEETILPEFEKGLARDKNIRIEYYGPDSVPANIDGAKFNRVLVNLLVNSIHAIEHENGLISVRVARENDGNIKIVVRDNGKGIPQENIPKLFQPYFTSGKKSGTGLGLAYCKQVVEACGGSIQVASKLDEGTTFTISMHNGL